MVISWHDRAEPFDYDEMNTDLSMLGDDKRSAIIARIYRGVELLKHYAARS